MLLTRSSAQPVQICSNLEGLSAFAARGIEISDAAAGPLAFVTQCLRSDLVIIDNDVRRLCLAAALKPFASFKLISVDLIVRPPRGIVAIATAAFKSFLLSRVDKFILYFRNTEGFSRYYRIRSDRTVYVPFKVNGLDQPFWPQKVPQGDHVLCAGRTLRDLETFVAAAGRTGLPAVLLQQPAEIMKEHGTTAWQQPLPSNIELKLHTDGQLETFISAVASARVVVIPRFKGDICSTGISTYLLAMALGKAVIISRGPGADDVLHDEAILVEPENVDELAAAISRIWHDDVERAQLGARAKRYAEKLGGTARLNDDIIRESLRCLPEPAAELAKNC
jgi:glycosyltransferase involved in cell wall biosynthesis